MRRKLFVRDNPERERSCCNSASQPGREGQREENLTSSTTSLLKPHSAFGADLPTLGPSESLLKLMLLDKIEPRDVEEELTVSTSETNRKPETQSASTPPQMPPPHSIILSSPLSSPLSPSLASSLLPSLSSPMYLPLRHNICCPSSLSGGANVSHSLGQRRNPQ